MATPIPHTLIVTETIKNGAAAQKIAAECPGVTDHCRSLGLCEQPGCDLEDEESDEVEAHGQQHIWVDDADGWYVPTADCYLVGHVYLHAAAGLLDLPAGRHPVIPHFGDTWDELELSVPQPTPTA